MSGEGTATRVLFVEDDELVVHLVTRFLANAGFEVTSAATGTEGLALARSGDFQVVLLDVDLPGGMDGIEVLRRLRREGDRIPVLMVSAIDDKPHIARSLDEGADDYVPKPVDPGELPARIRAVLRRHNQGPPSGGPRLLILDDLSFDESRRSIAGPLGEATLTATEAALLRELIRGAGRVVGTAELHDHIWGLDFDPGTNVVAAHVSRLRRKLEQVGTRVRLRARRGAGYELIP